MYIICSYNNINKKINILIMNHQQLNQYQLNDMTEPLSTNRINPVEAYKRYKSINLYNI